MGSSDGGISSDDTLAEEPPQRVSARRLALQMYDVGEAIGAGGMGEVLRARDLRIGRDVAIKRMRAAAPTPELVDRFLREAKIQARLDHPAIVPVYEVAHDADGTPYFTMKRIVGTTLLERLQRGDGSLQSLLRAFVDVCQAIDFAHARGVVHRDLKPANIILGEYGEVYVLDWGVARVLERDTAMTPAVGTPSVAPDAGGEAGRTIAGAVLGTPGYMAPEQARGELVGTSADVYSLGRILLEVLAVELKAGRVVPPELEALRASASADDAAARPSARELARGVQSYLDGDRDHEQRARLAAELVVRSRAAAQDPALRANAIRDAGRALALDPESADAASLVMSFMLEPPAQLPEPLVRRLSAIDTEAAAASARHAAVALTSGFLMLPLLLLAGVTSWPTLIAIFGLLGALAVHSRWSARARRPELAVPLVAGALLLVLLSRAFGPLVMSPTIAGLFVVGLGSQPRLIARPWLVLGTGLAGFCAPFALEGLGVFAPTWRLVDGHIEIFSQVVHLATPWAQLFLIAVHVLLISVMFVFMRQITATRRAARTQVEIQAWQLQQLLPAPPPGAELAAAILADLH